ncbi:putative baseplate assembly protein [Streptomyces sp. NPDC002265]|uniref:putative baseplate assembly protein n=1 Tax=Streptomyces sp. NPDC002265 TaxID=3154415 RepID=UPI0033293377
MTIDSTCEDQRRRAAVRAAGLAGIESVSADADRRNLSVLFFGRLPDRLDRHSFRIEGGRRVTGIQVVSVTGSADPESAQANHLTLRLDRPGDGSTYRLRALGEHFDARYDRMEFTFEPSVDDPGLAPAHGAGPLPDGPSPTIDYLAKDYASFRRLLLERLALTMPAWVERHAPDIGVTLVELLSYIGDQLSYQQDAVATEAYLDTARLRTSVRRHVRLVDYPMHEGCAARTFVCVETSEQLTLKPDDLAFTAFPPGRIAQTGPLIAAELLTGGNPVYRPLERRDIVLRPEHNRIELWTWGDQECSLPVGTTRATLLDQRPADEGGDRPLRLVPGDVIVFEELRGCATGLAADRDPTHRQAVRLTRVTPRVDALYDTKVLDVAWAEADALAFPLCVTTHRGPEPDPRPASVVACANTILVEHGIENTWGPGRHPETLAGPTARVHAPDTSGPSGAGCAGSVPSTGAAPTRAARRFSPTLRAPHVTWSPPHPRPADVAAAQAEALSQLADRARRRLAAIQRSGAAPSAGDQEFLRTLFKAGHLAGTHEGQDPDHVLASLLARFDEYLEPELRRLDVLAGRARCGYVLDPADIGWELAQTWGQEAARLIDPDHPALHGPASAALHPDPREALPAVRVWAFGTESGTDDWTARRDLLASGPRDRHMVGESDEQAALNLRFGDGRCGTAPPPGVELLAAYRTGNGRAGNVGSEAINRIASLTTRLDAVQRVRNPLPATGGTDPEPVADVRIAAPRQLLRTLRRAVTAEDYQTLAAGHPQVQRAAAALRWTGSWYEAAVALDTVGTSDVPRKVADDVRLALDRYRRIGHDVVTGPAVQVPLDVALTVLVEPDHLAGHVRRALLRTLRPGPQPGGGRGFFDPDVLTFGTPVRVSALIAAVIAVPGVRHAEVTRLRRLHRLPISDASTARDLPPSGVLRLRPWEIARLDGDSTRPEHGWLTLDLRGGR